MRVIAGKARGTRLSHLGDAPLRPTLDRVRESLFNQVSASVPDAWFLDLFAGTGAMGIEALSRGAREVVFVEPDPKAQKLIYSNLEKCKMFHPGEPDRTDKHWFLLKIPALRALKILEERGYRFDIVYVDPPFGEDLYEETLMALAASHLLKPTSLVVVEHHHKAELPEIYGTLARIKTRKLGDTRLSFFALE